MRIHRILRALVVSATCEAVQPAESIWSSLVRANQQLYRYRSLFGFHRSGKLSLGGEREEN